MFRLMILLRKRRNQVSEKEDFCSTRRTLLIVQDRLRCGLAHVALGPKEVVVALYDCRFAMERLSRILTAPDSLV